MNDLNKVTFTQDVKVLDHNGEITFKAKAGDVVELNQASAARWITRGKAVAGTVKKATAKTDAKTPAKK